MTFQTTAAYAPAFACSVRGCADSRCAECHDSYEVDVGQGYVGCPCTTCLAKRTAAVEREHEMEREWRRKFLGET